MEGFSQKKTTNGQCLSMDSDYPSFLKHFPGFADSVTLKSLFASPGCQQITICVYENLKGEEKRRIGGSSRKLNNIEEIRQNMMEMAKTLGIEITRALEVLTGEKS